MIAKAGKGTSIGRAVDYITDKEKADWFEARNIGDNDREIIKSDMNFTAAKSARVEKPVYHISVAWHKDEHPTKDQKLAVADGLLNHLELNDHQAVIASHNDKDHPHIHIVVNRVHPDTGKVWEPYLYRENEEGKLVQDKSSYERIEEYLRTTEKEMGFAAVAGKHAGEWDKEFDGKAPKIWEIKHQEKSENVAKGMGVENADLRPVKARAQDLKEELYQAETFKELDDVLARNGLWIMADGQGASITDGNYKVKASSVSRGLSGPKLEARFGESLKDYCERREGRIDLAGAESTFEHWGKLYQKKMYDEASKVAGRGESVAGAKLRELTRYDKEISAVQKDLQKGFGEAFSNGKEAYGLLNKKIKREGYGEAVSDLIANPGKFGKVTDRGAVVDISNSLRRLEHIRGEYSTNIQQMGADERAEKITSLNRQVQKWRNVQSGLIRPDDLTQGGRQKLRETEAGAATEQTASEVIALSRIANNFIADQNQRKVIDVRGDIRVAGLGGADEGGHKWLRWDEDSGPTFTFGKHEGKSLDHVIQKEEGYTDWMRTQDFADKPMKVIGDREGGMPLDRLWQKHQDFFGEKERIGRDSMDRKWLNWEEGEKPGFNFGKHKGKNLDTILNKHEKYIDWMKTEDFPKEFMQIIGDRKDGMSYDDIWGKHQDYIKHMKAIASPDKYVKNMEIAKATNIGKSSIQAGQHMLSRVAGAADSEAGQVAGNMVMKAQQYAQLASQIVSNPGGASIKIVKNIVQSSIRNASRAGRQATLGR